jgi:HlyD family secretion protein
VVLHPGMSSRAEIFTSGNEKLPGVPIAAILLEEDRSANTKDNYVFKFDNGVARKVKVELGIADDTYQAIRSGVTPGDRIITGPNRILRNLDDGDAVKEAEKKDEDKDNNSDSAG